MVIRVTARRVLSRTTIRAVPCLSRSSFRSFIHCRHARPPSMLAEQRHQYILSELSKNGALSVAELVRALDVSRETIRRDLNALAERGLIATTHGGALSNDRREPDLDVREAANARSEE